MRRRADMKNFAPEVGMCFSVDNFVEWYMQRLSELRHLTKVQSTCQGLIRTDETPAAQHPSMSSGISMRLVEDYFVEVECP